MSFVRAGEGSVLFLLQLLGFSLPCVSQFYIWQAGALTAFALDCLFKDVSIRNIKSLDHRTGMLMAPYTKFGFSKLGALLP